MKKVSTLEEVEGLFRGYYGTGLVVVSRSPYELVLEFPLFPSKLCHSFDDKISFSVIPVQEKNSLCLQVSFYNIAAK